MVTEGSTITFHISSGEGQVVVPDVQRDSESSARTRIEDAGLVASVQYATSSTVDEGYVISVSPGVGTALDKGSTVTITVSSGPETVTVPSVIGWTYNEALKELSALGLNVSLASGSSADGIVTDQTVIGSVEAGASIVLTTQLPEPTTPEGGTGSGSGDTTSDGSQTQGTTTGQSA